MTQMKDGGDPRTFAIIGAAIEVHNRIGCGFSEPVYQEALAIEFEHRGIPFQREVDLPILYRGRRLKTSFRADFICFGCIVVELKALVKLSGTEKAQILNYLKATGLEVALLLNFGTEWLEHERYVRTRAMSRAAASSASSASSADSSSLP